jgi:putative PIN family toxin of toxin-antitoxin system
VRRVVLDTNVLVSGIVSYRHAERVPAALLRAWMDERFELVVSEHILDELGRTLDKPYFRQRLSVQQIDRAVAAFRYTATMTPITREVHGIATHPEDDSIVATALSAGVDYLVSGDTQLQHLGTYEGVVILSPRAFLIALNEEAL